MPSWYRSQRKSWMDSMLFKESVREVDKRFTKEAWKVALLVDICPAHLSIDNLVSSKLIFLPPPSTTLKVQQMD